jgi:hypothetical protein
MLLGLAAAGPNVATRVMDAKGVPLDSLRQTVERTASRRRWTN